MVSAFSTPRLDCAGYVLGAAELRDGAFQALRQQDKAWAWADCVPTAASLLLVGERNDTRTSSAQTFLWRGRLDNREDVARTLGLVPDLASDTELARTAYLRWGVRCVSQFEGDWVLAAWDHRARRLTLSRDPYGNSAWFFSLIGDVVVFSTGLPALVRALEPCEINRLALARLLVAWRSPDGRATAYEGIQRVPPAHTVVLQGGQQHWQRYWRLEEVSRVPLKGDEAHIEWFAEHFHRAVERRIWDAGPFASTLSAGLDSSSVTIAAARALARRGESLLALTAVPLASHIDHAGSGSPGDEGPLAAEVARSGGNILHVCLDAADTSPIEGIRQMLQIQGQPGIAAANYYWILRLMSFVRESGRTVLLTGQMGNAVWSWPGRPAHRFAALWGGAWPGVRTWLGRVAPRGAAVYRRWRRPGECHGTGSPWLAYSAIRADYARSVQLDERMAEVGHDPSFRYRERSDRDARLALLLPASIPIGSFWTHLSHAFRVDVRDPSQDKALLGASWALPDHLWWRDRPRCVIRRVMEGLLPDVVRLGAGGHSQSVDLLARLQACRREVFEAIEEASASDVAAGCVDLARCRQIAERLSSARPPTLLELKAVLMRGLDTALFLAGLNRARRGRAV